MLLMHGVTMKFVSHILYCLEAVDTLTCVLTRNLLEGESKPLFDLQFYVYYQ